MLKSVLFSLKNRCMGTPPSDSLCLRRLGSSTPHS